MQVPALEALLPRFAQAHTQPLGLSIDSVHCHANWGASLGGVSFPLLSYFHPKGAVAESLGAYLAQAGITDRATAIIDAGGTVRYAESVGPGGKRDIEALAAECEKIDAAYDGPKEALPTGSAPTGDRLFIKSNCGFSRAVSLARTNLHLADAIPVVNITEDAAAKAELEGLAGKTQAPCLMHEGQPMFESADIIEGLRKQTLGW